MNSGVGGSILLFNSYIFILFFLPVCILGYFSLNNLKKFNLAQLYLLILSLWFYGYFNPSYLLIIAASIVINYLLSYAMSHTARTFQKKAAVLTGIAFNLGILFYYKYYDFFIENINALFATDYTLKHILLPLGISFFTFQQLSYVIDAYRGEVAQYGFLQYASFVVYFPQLVAGPIVTHDELIPQFMDESKKHFQWDNFEKGLYIFALGLAKKVLLADVFGNAANWGYSNLEILDATNAALTALAYTIQIYFDFSGYCDMAIGIGQMMNIDLPVNFDSPYKAVTITDFWSRWHKTLTRFFTRYIYIPLGGNRKGLLRTCINIMVVYLCSGFWHGANWTFVLWGIMHGAFSVVTRCCSNFFRRIPDAVNWLITFSFVNIAWVFFRADSIRDAAFLLSRLFGMEWGPVNANIARVFLLPEFEVVLGPIRVFGYLEAHPGLCSAIFFGGAMVLILGARNAYQHMRSDKRSFGSLLFAAVLLIWCVLSFSSVSTFLYFNF